MPVPPQERIAEIERTRAELGSITVIADKSGFVAERGPLAKDSVCNNRPLRHCHHQHRWPLELRTVLVRFAFTTAEWRSVSHTKLCT